MRKAILFIAGIILASSPMLFCQDETPSLGEIARKYRAEKELREAAGSLPSAPQSAAPQSSPATPQRPATVLNIRASAAIKPEVEMNSPIVAPAAHVPALHQSATPGDAVRNVELRSVAVTSETSGPETTPETTKTSKVMDAPVFPSATPQQSKAQPPKVTRSEATDVPVFRSASPSQPARPALPQRATAVSPVVSNTPVFPSAMPESAKAQGPTSGNAGQTSEDQHSEMEDIYTSIDQNLQTPEGEKYSNVFAREFALKNSRAVRECLEAGAKDPGPFDVVVQVAGAGVAQQAMIFPDTGVTGCLRHRLATASFSAPPAPGYWVKVTLTTR
jgi:hypothetical protein